MLMTVCKLHRMKREMARILEAYLRHMRPRKWEINFDPSQIENVFSHFAIFSIDNGVNKMEKKKHYQKGCLKRS